MALAVTTAALRTGRGTARHCLSSTLLTLVAGLQRYLSAVWGPRGWCGRLRPDLGAVRDNAVPRVGAVSPQDARLEVLARGHADHGDLRDDHVLARRPWGYVCKNGLRQPNCHHGRQNGANGLFSVDYSGLILALVSVAPSRTASLPKELGRCRNQRMMVTQPFCVRALLTSPVREFRKPGSARGPSGNRWSYLRCQV